MFVSIAASVDKLFSSQVISSDAKLFEGCQVRSICVWSLAVGNKWQYISNKLSDIIADIAMLYITIQLKQGFI